MEENNGFETPWKLGYQGDVCSNCPLPAPVPSGWHFTWLNHGLHSHWHWCLSENVVKIVMFVTSWGIRQSFCSSSKMVPLNVWPFTILLTYGVARDLRHMETKPSMKDCLWLKQLLSCNACLKDWGVLPILAHVPTKPDMTLDDQRHS